jgi:hypothetical protein
LFAKFVDCEISHNPYVNASTSEQQTEQLTLDQLAQKLADLFVMHIDELHAKKTTKTKRKKSAPKIKLSTNQQQPANNSP